MSEPRAIIFDFNGVIIDDEHLHCRAFAETVAEWELRLDEHDYFTKYLGLNDKNCFEAFFRDHQVTFDDATIFERMERKAAHYLRLLDQGMVLYRGVPELIRELAAHVPLAIASGARRNEIARVLELSGLTPCFQTFVSADDVKEGKPSPAVYRAAFEVLRARHPALQPGDCLVIEDAPNGILAAKAAGMRCVAVTTSVPASALGAADRVIGELGRETWSSLARA